MKHAKIRKMGWQYTIWVYSGIVYLIGMLIFISLIISRWQGAGYVRI